MKVKALWGFVGAQGKIRAGDVIEVDDEYGHALLGKGLVKEVGEVEEEPVKVDEDPAKPKVTKPAPQPKETK